MIQVIQKQRCTGCYACSTVCPEHCIAMKSDTEGFGYPEADVSKCIRCGLCEKVCPVMNKQEIHHQPQAYACYAADEEIRMHSSSGGIFPLLAEQVIDSGGVVFGAGFEIDFTVVHGYAQTKEELGKFRGSKYVQSKIGDAYKAAKEFLEQGRPVLFTGTPCQVEGLKSYLGKPYANLFCVDMVCHGVPSPKVWRKYISYRESCAKSGVRAVDFRDKSKGWKSYHVFFVFQDGTRYQKVYHKDFYMNAFLKDICLRPSCYDCPFKTLQRQSDITLADFWGIQDILPELDDDKGTSLIFVHTAKGQFLLERIKERMVYQETDIYKAVEYNPSAVKSARYHPKRDDFFDDLDRLPFDKLAAKYCSERAMVLIGRWLKVCIYRIVKKLGLFNMVRKFLGRT